MSGFGFYALIMAAMRQADTDNAERLRRCWPDVWQELHARYNAPGGILPDDVLPEDDDTEPSPILRSDKEEFGDEPSAVEDNGSKVIDLMEALKRALATETIQSPRASASVLSTSSPEPQA